MSQSSSFFLYAAFWRSTVAACGAGLSEESQLIAPGIFSCPADIVPDYFARLISTWAFLASVGVDPQTHYAKLRDNRRRIHGERRYANILE